MKKSMAPLLFLMLALMACSLTGRSTPTPVPTVSEVVLAPTETRVLPPTKEPTVLPPEPTEAPIADTPTEEPTEEASPYFYEEFDGDLSAWSPFVIAGDPDKDYAKRVGDRLKFELPNSETYAYIENLDYTFDDVYVETTVETVKGGENGISVFCRGSNKGFYEFRIHTVGRNAGSIEAYRFDFTLRERNKVPYVNLLKDRERLNTYDIKAGFKTNVVGLMCVGNEIRLFLNGVEQLPMPGGEPIRDDVLTEGSVGIGAMSFSQGVVDVEFDNVSTSAP